MCSDLTLNSVEYQKIVYDWNDNYSAYPAEKTIHQLFEEQVLRTPNNNAVVCEGQHLTYLELNTQANQLARLICKEAIHCDEQKLKPNTIVLLCLNRSSDLLIAILGILKAGGSYLPIDPVFPPERLQYIIKESKSTLLLTHSAIANNFKNVFDSNIITLDEKPYVLECGNNLIHREKSMDPAYVMLTSGTTEQPKAVMIPHRAVSRLVRNTDYIKITKQDRILHAANVSFDAATFEIWGALLNGASLYIISDELLLNISQLGDFLSYHAISIMWLTSALFNQCAERAPFIFRHLIYLLVGGEVLSPKHITYVLTCEQGKPEHILNGYGPTENTTFTTIYDITEIDSNKSIPIGRPINNTSVYILNEELQPVPIGVIGEIYIGGAGLALGYLNQPELTAEKFISNPFVKSLKSDPTQKLYKSGDRGRWLHNGDIEYINRVDFQIKHLGYRIELNEIENQLSLHPRINQSVVIYQNSILVAFVTLTESIEAPIKISKILKTFLQKKLPSYMLPSTYIVLDKFPITTSGKIDRLSLAHLRYKKTRLITKPRNDIEKKLSDIWSEIFKTKAISMDDNFFDLGGNSLLFYAVITKIKDLFGVTVKIKSLRENLTIPDLARHIEIITAVYAVRPTFDDNGITESWDNSIQALNIKNPHLPIIYFIHPIFGSCESYKHLADALESKFQSLGINNYNMYHRVKIKNISTLANYYINKIQASCLLKEPIRLFGWSLAGKIVLEMAYHLEKQGFKNIHIYLLDTILYDESRQKYLDSYIENFPARLLKENIEPSYIKKAMDEVINPMILMSKTPLSGELSYAKCLLFKAKENNNSSEPCKFMLDNISLSDNNLQKKFMQKIKIKQLNCHHENIIEQTTQISRVIGSFDNSLT